MKTLFILNAPTGGSDLTYKGLRLANMLAKREHHEASAFMMDDAVGAAKQGRKLAEGFANPKSMQEGFAQGDGSRVGVCVGVPEARGTWASDLATVTQRETLYELANWSEWAGKVFTF